MTGTPATRAATIAPYLDNKTAAIVRIDVAAINVDQVLTEMSKPEHRGELVTDEQIAQAKAQGEKAKEFQKLVQEAYVIVTLTDVPAFPPYTVIKMHPGADAKKVFAAWQKQDVNAPVDQKVFDESCLVNGDILVIGSARVMNRLKAPVPFAVPNLEQAFTLAGDAPLQAIYIPTDEARSTLGALAIFLPSSLGIDAPLLLGNINFAAATIKPSPGFEMHIDVQGRDAAAAQRLLAEVTKMFEKLRLVPGTDAETLAIINGFMPQLNNDRLSVALKEGDPLYKQLETLAMKSAAEAQEAARRMVVMNNMKQIALAMHSHQDAKGKLPAARPTGTGLSWRVHLLPYLEQAELYQQFKLDEAWDSPTNRPLVEKMPAVFENKNAKTVMAGMTTFVVPVGVDTAFPPNAPVGITEIQDGTSNTIMVLEVNADKAVVWTKPDDWEMDPSMPLAGLGTNAKNGAFHVAMCDGATLALNTTIDGELFRRLIQRNDGQMIDPASLAAFRAPASGFPSFGFGGPATAGLPSTGPNPLAVQPRLDERGNPIVPMPLSGDPLNPQNPGNPNNPLAPVAPPDPPFIAEAKKAFADGREHDAMQFVYAEAIAGEDKDNLKGSLQWVPGLKRPALAVRWGIAVQYRSPANYNGSPSPIGRPHSGGAPQPGNTPDPNMPKPDAEPTAILDYFVAELGAKVIEGLKTRVEVSQFGEAIKTYRGESTAVAGGAAPFNPVPVNPQPVVGAGAAAAKPGPDKPVVIMPGVVFLGAEKATAASDKNLLAKAQEEGLDAVIVYEIAVTPNRTTVVNNTKLMILDTIKGESLHASRVLKNTAVEEARQEKKVVDPVENVIERFFEAVDTNFTMGELPKGLNATNVTARVMKLAETPPADKLELLLEIAFWQAKGMLSPENALVAYEKLLGPDGAKLAGTPAEKKAVIETLLPKPPAAGNSGKRIGLGP